MSFRHEWAGDMSRIAIYKHFVPTALGGTSNLTPGGFGLLLCCRGTPKGLSWTRPLPQAVLTRLDRRLMTRANILAVSANG